MSVIRGNRTLTIDWIGSIAVCCAMAVSGGSAAASIRDVPVFLLFQSSGYKNRSKSVQRTGNATGANHRLETHAGPAPVKV